MTDFNQLLEDIAGAEFFSNMGDPAIQDETVILIADVERAFIHPSDTEFQGLYTGTEWLPTSLTQEDPFYKHQPASKELSALRKKINQAVLDATKGLRGGSFICSPHDFRQAARNAICFAFRQYVSESYLNLGNEWGKIIQVYYAGHWPVGFTEQKIIAI